MGAWREIRKEGAVNLVSYLTPTNISSFLFWIISRMVASAYVLMGVQVWPQWDAAM